MNRSLSSMLLLTPSPLLQERKKKLIMPKSLFSLFFSFLYYWDRSSHALWISVQSLVDTDWKRENKNEKLQTMLEVVFCRQGRMGQSLEGM